MKTNFSRTYKFTPPPFISLSYYLLSLELPLSSKSKTLFLLQLRFIKTILQHFYTVIQTGPFTSPVLPLFFFLCVCKTFTNLSREIKMSSSVCQGLQSCLEPRLVEPRVIIQNLSPQTSTLSDSISCPQKPNLSHPQFDNHNDINHYDNDNNKNITCYSFRDSKQQNKKNGDSFWSSMTSQDCKQMPDAEAEAARVYVHPLVKRSSSTLSTRSLEMCTESLGSESGSSIGESMDEFSIPLPERSNTKEIPRSKIYRSASFPPPLTSIGGSEGVQMRPHREGGRLVLKAVSVSSCSPYFQTERSNGRLRLSLLKSSSEEHLEEFEQKRAVINNVMHRENGADDEEEDDCEITACSEDEDFEVNDENVGYEVEVGELPRPTRCKEGGASRNKGVASWEPFWVAIS